MLYKSLVLLLLIYASNSACPTNCATCNAAQTKCLTCTAPHTFLTSTELCQACSVANCQSCGTDGKCLVCKPDFQPIIVNGELTCAAACVVKNCKTCGTKDAVTGITPCTTCADGFFKEPIYSTCIPCKTPCGTCTISGTIYSSKIFNTLKTALTAAFTGTTTIPVTQGSSTTMPFPYFLSNIINDAINNTVATNWTMAYFVYNAFKPFTNTTINLKAVASAAVRIADELYNIHTIPQLNIAIVTILNKILGTKFTVEEFIKRVGAAVAVETTCSVCLDNYILDTTCKSCVSLIDNCLKCSSTTVCTECQAGYFASSATPPVCTACSSNCKTCASATDCSYCYPPYSLTDTVGSKTCQLCNQPCATCVTDSLSACLTCIQPYSYTASGGGVCYRCIQDSCRNCDQLTKAICTVCRDGYNLLSNGTCSSCKQNNCYRCLDNKCYQCMYGYRLNTTTGQCVACGPGCLSCSNTNSSLCSYCKQGSYNQLTTQTCKPCSKACLTCDNPFTCIKAKQAITIFNNQVIKCRPGCIECNPQNPQKCIKCQPRFIAITGVCTACPKGCQVCSDATTCTKCAGNLVKVAGVCTPCEGYCNTCRSTNTSQCLSCVSGYNYDSTAKTCTRNCDRNCQSCNSIDSTLCIQCKPGNALKLDGTCIKCLKSCSGTCNPKNITQCLSCIDGFQLVDNQCKRCSSGCRYCLNNQCAQCEQGYKLWTDANNNQVCVKACPFPCSTCSSGTCSACESGYKLTANKVCQADIICNPNCQFCPLGSYNSATLPTITCAKCTKQGCADCPADTCKTCMDGYYLDSTTCKVCDKTCVTCFDASTCKICAPGYTKQLISLGDYHSTSLFNNTCIPCDSNCLTCDVQPNRCTSCPYQTYLVGFRCVNIYTVGFIYKLDYNYNTFLSSGEAQRFIAKLASIAQVSIDNVFINSIKSGSTQVSGSVGSSGSGNAQQIQQSLASGNTGYTVLSSTATVYYGDTQVPPQNTANKPNVGLIVGVTIGSVAAAVIIAIIIYKVVQSRQEGDHARIQDTSYAKDKIGTNDKIRQ